MLFRSLSGLNVDVFASIFMAAIHGVSLLKDDSLLGTYVPDSIDSNAEEAHGSAKTDEGVSHLFKSLA